MLKKYIASFLLSVTVLTAAFVSPASANTVHTVSSGDTLWKLGVQYGVPVNSIRNVNNKSTDTIFIGERLTIPSTISATDRDLLAKLVRAEAEGEPYAGKVAVATVVLNRVDNHQFPNTVRGVIYEVTPTGHYAFSPVASGRINRAADAESVRAVNEALAFRGQGSGSIYFYNPRIATNQWITTRPVTVRIGNHVFAR